jgi:hypothetical protein
MVNNNSYAKKRYSTKKSHRLDSFLEIKTFLGLGLGLDFQSPSFVLVSQLLTFFTSVSLPTIK